MRDSYSLQAEIALVDGDHVETGTICAVDRGVLRVTTRLPYQEGERVRVRIGSCEASGIVMYSVLNERAFRTAIVLRHSRKNRRSERRLPVGCSGRITIIAEMGGDTFDGIITDMSSSGMGLRSSRELQLADGISIETRSCVVFGEVVHCIRKDDGMFQAGVRVEELLSCDADQHRSRRGGWLRRLLRKDR